MKNKQPWRWLACVGASALVAHAAQAAADAPSPPSAAEQFARLPQLGAAEISPSGRRLAVIMFNPVSGNDALGVIDLDPLGPPRMVANFSDADVHSVQWVNDGRLVFSVGQRESHLRYGGGTYAVDADGSHQVALIAWRGFVQEHTAHSRLLPPSWRVVRTLDDGSDDVIVAKAVYDASGQPLESELARLNTSNGLLTPMNRGVPDHTWSWLLDDGGEPRMLMTIVADRLTYYWRRRDDEPWTAVGDFPRLAPDYDIARIDDDGQIYVTSRKFSGFTALYKFDPEARKIDPEPVLQVKGFDLAFNLEEDSRTHRLLGVQFVTDRSQSYWFDAGMAELQHGIDAALPPGRSNRILCGRCASSRFFVIWSHSDRQPGEYFLFDRSKHSLQAIGATRPWIDEATQGTRSFHRVQARDGLSIPLYVTQPPDSRPGQPLPAVMLVHGGPWLRGGYVDRWDRDAQFLASRGYLVLEPEFRGSQGYGWELFHAGWKQWGRAMQDDLVDSLRWAVDHKLVDPGRVCIMGGSYGGYAALMGPIASPGVYRCAISLAGVTDIDLMYDVTWSDTSEEWKQYGMPTLIGDPDKDAALLAQASPLRRVAEIKVPVLLAQGTDDWRVPMVHANKFVSAAKAAGVEVESVFYDDEGHGLRRPEDEADFLGRVERFLARSLQPAKR